MRTFVFPAALVVAVFISGRVMSAQSAAGDGPARNKALVQAGLEAWAAGTGSPYDLLADDATWTIVGRSAASKTYQGREAFMREVIRPFNARMRSPLKPVIRRLYADGDHRLTDRKGRLWDAAAAWYRRHSGQRLRAGAPD